MLLFKHVQSTSYGNSTQSCACFVFQDIAQYIGHRIYYMHIVVPSFNWYEPGQAPAVCYRATDGRLYAHGRVALAPDTAPYASLELARQPWESHLQRKTTMRAVVMRVCARAAPHNGHLTNALDRRAQRTSSNKPTAHSLPVVAISEMGGQTHRRHVSAQAAR